MTQQHGFSKMECKIIMDQIERRAKFRKEFMKARTDPCKHSQGAYYVFDPAVQRYLSMKVSQLEHFTANPRTIRAGLLMIVLPMSVYGYAIWTKRQEKLRQISCGELKYKDRMFKLQ